MARSKSSDRWLQRHVSDEFVKRARREGARSRAIYKLEEIAERDHLLQPGMVVVDLGAAPGGWSQYAAKRVGARGRVIALDLLPMEPIQGIDFIQGDFTESVVLDLLLERLGGLKVDLVMSDMAPNISGVAVSDQGKTMYLAELALDFADKTLKPGGSFLIKVFQGLGFQALHRNMQQRFKQVMTRKPKASRAESREMYLLCKGFNGAPDGG
jgi:23S rRNA (uridine2552-2'-O)-methyltransferase